MRLWIRIALLAIVFLLLAGLVPVVQLFYRMEVPRHVELGELAKTTRLRFPNDANLIGSSLQEGADWSIRAVVTIKQSDINKFITSAKQEYSLQEEMAFSHIEKRHRHPDWWTPYTAGHFRDFTAVSLHIGITGQARIRIATDDPQYSVIYLDWTGKP